jgi:cyclic pyranopterin phosphate synthase
VGLGNGARDLVDPFGRVVRDLRISVTDRCNFRCTYCMPEEGMQWIPRSEILSFEEIERIARICVSALGVDLAMTTNGATLRNLAGDLRAAGLNRLNISLDTLDRQRFAEMTRRDELSNVLDGIEAAKRAGFDPVKINTVVERGVNSDEIVDLARFGREQGVEVRFIEFMPLDASDAWQRATVVGQDEIVATIEAVWPLEQMPARGAAPADRWRYRDGAGTVGVIPTVTKPFCGDCDRVRLTADGQFRTCLFATDEFDLRAAIRSGESDEQVAARIERAVGTKWAGHQINQVNFIRPTRSMSQIGG